MSELPWFYNIFNPEMIEKIKKKVRERAVPIEYLSEDDDRVNDNGWDEVWVQVDANRSKGNNRRT